MTDKLNFCCPSQKSALQEDFRPTISNAVPRISCNISESDFAEQYIMKRKVVILEGCLKEWSASKWTFDSLLHSKPHWTFSAIVRLGYDSLTETHPCYKPSHPNSPYQIYNSKELLRLKAQNATIKVIDRTGSIPRWGRREGSSDKPEIFEAYTQPKPIPKCLAKSTFGGNPNDWLLMSTKFTGTFYHADPYLMDAWNALVQGHKVI